jgi:hypothetical protein
MKRTTLLAVAGGILAAVALCVGATSSDPSQERSQIEQLKQEVASLRQRVESLEKHLKDHAFIVPRDGRDSPMIIRPHLHPGLDWRSFEFNGMRFYVVPISTSQPPAQEPTNQSPALQK